MIINFDIQMHSLLVFGVQKMAILIFLAVIYNKQKSTGPRMLPCGIPLVTGHNSLLTVGEKNFNPLKYLALDTISLKFDKKTSVRHFIKGLFSIFDLFHKVQEFSCTWHLWYETSLFISKKLFVSIPYVSWFRPWWVLLLICKPEASNW